MRITAGAALSLLVILSLACGGSGRPGLLGEMPAGLDFYITFRPEEVGVSHILTSLGESGLDRIDELALVGAALGVDPLSWEGWVEAAGIDPEGEIGVAGYLSGGGSSAAAVFLPVADPSALESLRAAAVPDAGMRVSEWRDGMWVLYASRLPQQLEMMADAVEAGERLADTDDFTRLWDALDPGEADIYLYARTHDRPELDALLLALEEEGSVARGAAAALPSGDRFSQSLEVMSRGPAGHRPGLPPDVDVVVRSTVDMGAAIDMAEDRMPPDAEQGLAMLGFDSVEDMLSMFSGDSWAAVDLSGDRVRGMGAIGLDDPSAMEGFLRRLSGFAAMGEQGIDRIQSGGVSGYSIPVSSVPGSLPLEVGVSGSALYILYGYSLEDSPAWSSAPGPEEALGVDEGAPVFISGDLSGLRRHVPGDTGDMLPEAGRFALSIRSEGNAAVLEGALDTGEERAFAAIVGAAFTTGMRLYEARVNPPEEVDSK